MKELIRKKSESFLIRGCFFSQVMLLLLLSLTVNLFMCKKNANGDIETGKVTLAVNLSEGVSGTPVNGSALYQTGERVHYTYTLKDGYKNLVVSLNGTVVSASGDITMDRDHRLDVTAEIATSENFTLTVDAGTGITGTPVSGTYTYSENSAVSYSYSLQDGYKDLQVLLDGTAVAAEGEITMDQDHSLTVTAVEGYDITGEWELELTVNTTGSDAAIQETINVDVEFSGTASSGSIFINGNNVGTYTVQNNVVGFFYQITDPILGQLKYVYTGTFTTNDTMGGDVIIYKITAIVANISNAQAEVEIKRGKWSGKRKKKK